MNKVILNNFNVSIYQELVKRFNYDLRQLEKHYLVNDRMFGYYEKKDFDYIEGVYIDDLIDIINCNLFNIFVPSRIKKDILEIVKSIKVQKNNKNYNRCIESFKKIFNMINVKLYNFDV